MARKRSRGSRSGARSYRAPARKSLRRSSYSRAPRSNGRAQTVRLVIQAGPTQPMAPVVASNMHSLLMPGAPKPPGKSRF